MPAVRRREIERLFSRTAAAFGSPVPERRPRSARALLAGYARFTRERAEAALDSGENLEALGQRLFRAAFAMGGRYRVRLGVRGRADVMAAARIIYRVLGIDFAGSPRGDVTIRRCAFAFVYSPRVCTLISALDRGLLAGLSAGGDMRFIGRLTEGASACRAHLAGGAA